MCSLYLSINSLRLKIRSAQRRALEFQCDNSRYSRKACRDARLRDEIFVECLKLEFSKTNPNFYSNAMLVLFQIFIFFSFFLSSSSLCALSALESLAFLGRLIEMPNSLEPSASLVRVTLSNDIRINRPPGIRCVYLYIY